MDNIYLFFKCNINSPEELAVLAEDHNYKARYYVACHENTDIKTLELLSQDEDWNIKRCIAERADIPIHILHKLSADSTEIVRMSALKNKRNIIKNYIKASDAIQKLYNNIDLTAYYDIMSFGKLYIPAIQDIWQDKYFALNKALT